MSAIDLNTLVPDLLDLGFSLGAQVTATVTFTHPTGTTYDPATGVHTLATQTATATAILKTYSARETDGERIKVGDRQAIIRMSELSAITSKGTEDTLTIGGAVWQVVDFMIDPTNSVYRAQIRKAA